MNRTLKSASIVLALALGGASLSACATKEYVNEQIATVNSRIDGVDAKATSAGQAAQAAQAAAAQAQTDATTANQRLDQLTGRVDRLEQMPAKRPRN